MASIFKRQGKGSYVVAWFDHEGRRRQKSTRTTDKSAATRIANKIEADTALRRDGVVDPQLDAICDESRRSVESHLVDFENKMKAGGRKAKHIDTTSGIIRAIAEDGQWASVADISADAVNQYAGTLKAQGRSAQTIKNHLTAIKGFSKWLANNHKLPRDPLASVSKPNPKADRRRERRMLLPDEWSWLQATAPDGPERYGIAGTE